jgi:hypothetical protein
MLITTQQGQITERFTRAVEQLGKKDGSEGEKAGVNSQKNLASRLGDIYALCPESLRRDRVAAPNL